MLPLPPSLELSSNPRHPRHIVCLCGRGRRPVLERVEQVNSQDSSLASRQRPPLSRTSLGVAAHATAIQSTLGVLLAFGTLSTTGGGYYGLSGAEGVPFEWLEEAVR